MATHASADKAARQAIRHEVRNRHVRSTYRTAIKKLLETLKTNPKKGEETAKVQVLLNDVQRVLMKAASKKVIKRGTASRYISRLSIRVHKASAQA